MTLYSDGNHTYETFCDMIEVTSSHRPNPGWIYVDVQGHEHRWFDGDSPALFYNPQKTYTHPTLKWVHEGWGSFEDGEIYEIGHHACAQCDERIEPGYTADNYPSYIPGLRYFLIDGKSVSKEEFERRLSEVRHV